MRLLLLLVIGCSSPSAGIDSRNDAGDAGDAGDASDASDAPAAAGQLGDPCPCASCSTYCIGLTQAAVEEFAALDGAGAASYAALCLPVADGWACGFGCDRLVGTLDADLARLCQVLGGRCSPTVESGQRLWCIP